MDERVENKISFIESWIEAEEFYADLFSHKGWDYVKPIMPLIDSLRQKGYDKSLRAGQSLYTFVLSRSINWGLRQDQHSLIIEPTTQNKFRVWYSDGQNPINELETDNLIDNKQFWLLIERLKLQPLN
jgi:hypothetical protein